MNTTINYYNLNAKNFIENTQNADMHLAQEKFLQLLPGSASILDFGCGSGRDTKYFLEKGYQVASTDGSAELCRLAGSFTGIKVKEMPKQELLSVIQKMCIALKDNGVIYTSFKYSNFEGERNGRYFTDFMEDTFREFIKVIPELTVEDQWITLDVRPGRGEEKWLNLILRKNQK